MCGLECCHAFTAHNLAWVISFLFVAVLAQGTVGAGLPIIGTLKHLLETGDKAQRVEGIFSGTLSYIFNNFGDGRPFSQIVAEAKANVSGSRAFQSSFSPVCGARTSALSMLLTALVVLLVAFNRIW